MPRFRFNPWRNLGCIGIYTDKWGFDFFVRPYVGMFMYRGNRKRRLRFW